MREEGKLANQRNQRIAIIGGAASGVALLDQLVLHAINSQKKESIAEIAIYEKGNQFGLGLAYGTSSDSHILNMANNTMSLRPGEPDQFKNYLQNNDINDGTNFAKRKVFGNYLQNHFSSVLRAVDANGITVYARSNLEVTDIQQINGGYQVNAPGEEPSNYDKIFLCIGNQPNTVLSEYEGCRGFYSEPYKIDEISKNIPRNEDIVIIGSGLTAIDTYLGLRESGHNGKITFVSRHGILPKVRGKARPYTLRYLSPRNIDTLTNRGERNLPLDQAKRLFLKELIHAGLPTNFIETEQRALSELPTVEILKRDLHLPGTEENTCYLSVLKAVDSVIGHIWKCMPTACQLRFDKHHKRLWDIYDYPMPRINAIKILSELENQNLINIKGLSFIARQPKTQAYHLGDVSGKQFSTNYLINAIGPNHDITQTSNPLIQNLRHHGLIHPHPLGGINVDFDTGLTIKPGNKISNSLYVVGSLTRGVHFYTNSLFENVQAAERAARHCIMTLPVQTPRMLPC